MIDFKRKYAADSDEDRRAMQFLTGLFGAWFAVALAFAVFHSADADAGCRPDNALFVAGGLGGNFEAGTLGQQKIDGGALGQVRAGVRLGGLTLEYFHISDPTAYDSGLNGAFASYTLELDLDQ